MAENALNLALLLKSICDVGASDLHLKSGRPPLMRHRGDVVLVQGYGAVTAADIRNLLGSVLTPVQLQRWEAERELDFSFYVTGLARFRGNAYYQKGYPGAAFRVIPSKVPTLAEVGLPEVLREQALREQGLFLITGPTGSGKTTSLAALINEINETRPVHVVTLEDPIEFVFEDKKAVINQREVGSDTLQFSEGLRRALRQDPDVILIGELRDPETITTALNAAETGHLVLGTLHTNDAKQAIDRLLDAFPPDGQNQIRLQLAQCLNAVVAQRLVKRGDGEGQVAVHEVLINSPTIQKLIEDNRIGAIGKAMEESASYYHMQTFNQGLFQLVEQRLIEIPEALAFSPSPNDLKILFQTHGLLSAQADVPIFDGTSGMGERGR